MENFLKELKEVLEDMLENIKIENPNIAFGENNLQLDDILKEQKNIDRIFEKLQEHDETENPYDVIFSILIELYGEINPTNPNETIIYKNTPFGTIKVSLPFKTGMTLCIRENTKKFTINKITMIENNIYLVNNYTGLWINIDDIEKVDKLKDQTYITLKNKE